jgi:hypothetical protein
MASSMARDGRRRRVLNDEARTASGLSVTAYRDAADADAPRYGEQASVEHHPQVTDYVPRRKRAVVMTLLLGASTAAAAQALVRFADSVAAAVPGVAAPDLSHVAGGVIAWASAVSLLLCAMLAKLIYSLRRHRVDDYAGRYRVWRWISWGAVLASMNSVIQVHGTIARLAVAATGMSFTETGAEWWLAPLALIGGWIFVRLLFEVRESRSSLAVIVMAAACYVAAAAGALGWSPAVLAAWGNPLTFALPLVGHTIALAGLMVFGRYVVLDVQGLITHAPPRRSRTKAEKAAAPVATVKLSSSSNAEAKLAHAAEKSPVNETWDEEDGEEEAGGPGLKLSKADRKRLRKQQRAA